MTALTHSVYSARSLITGDATPTEGRTDMRKADKITRNASDALVSETFELGHWEAMQLSIALDKLADTTSDYLTAKLNIRDLAALFGSGEATFTITKTQTYVD